MQHYRLPTRLLDWTESPLIGCYFATSQDPAIQDHPDVVEDTDGALFALSPYLLNESQIGQRALLLPNDPKSLSAIERAFSSRVKPADYVVALRPAEVDARLMVQLSVFTLHGSNLDILDLQGRHSFLRKFIVPKSAKIKIREEHKYLGIRESSIFPDLEHLASDVSATKFKPPQQPSLQFNDEMFDIPRDPESSS